MVNLKLGYNKFKKINFHLLRTFPLWQLFFCRNARYSCVGRRVSIAMTITPTYKNTFCYNNKGLWMVHQNFAVLAKLGFCSESSQNFSECSFTGARIFLQVLACSVFRGGSFFKVLVARKAGFCQCSCSQRKTLCSHACKCSQRLFNTPITHFSKRSECQPSGRLRRVIRKTVRPKIKKAYFVR